MTAVDALGRIQQILSGIAALQPGQRQKGASGTGTDFATQLDAASVVGLFTGAAATAPLASTATRPAAHSGSAVTGQDIVADAEQYLGVPYVFGGEDRSGMDCSGLVQTVLGDLGISAPRVVPDQARLGTEVPSLADARPGDLIVEKGNGHIQIYAGDGMIIEAPKPGENVVKRPEWLSADQIGTIRRVTTDATPARADATASVAPTAGGALTVSTLTALASALSASGLGETTADAALGTDSDSTGRLTEALTAAAVGGGDQVAALLSAALGLPGTAGATPAIGAAGASPSDLPAAPAVAPHASPTGGSGELARQLAAPIAQLASGTAGSGDHSVLVRVTPEQLGPVTVDARFGEHGMHITLSSPNDSGRDALSGILGELRRDLAQAGVNASVSLGAGGQQTAQNPLAHSGYSGQPAGQQALFDLLQQGQGQGRNPQPGAPQQPGSAVVEAPRGPALTAAAGPTPSASALDVLA